MKQSKLLEVLLFFVIALFIISGMIISGPQIAVGQFINIQFIPSRLINDFIEIGGHGGALINSALVGLIGLLLVLFLGVKLSGPTFAAVLTLMGFGLFGKTVLNILPIILGVYLSGRFVGKEFREYILIALFGTALGPVVSFVAFEFGLTGYMSVIASTGFGVIAGFILPSIAVSMLHLHQGYNLYNMGLTCGFFGLFAAAFIIATGHTFEGTLHWYDEKSLFLKSIVPILSLIFIVAGLVSGGRKAVKAFFRIQKIPGRLPSDFMVMETIEGSLINCGVVGLVGSAYVYFVDGDFNGPVIGGLLTIIGFSAFGTTLKNSWPVVAGVILSTLVFGFGLDEPGPILAAIFVTTLAPLAGEFGPVTGIIAGFIHLAVVLETGAWYGGMNLYNNGFAGGLTAALIVAVIQWYSSNKPVQKTGFRR